MNIITVHSDAQEIANIFNEKMVIYLDIRTGNYAYMPYELFCKCDIGFDSQEFYEVYPIHEPEKYLHHEDTLRSRCGSCGHYLQAVRPGKWQCNNEHCESNLIPC